MREAASLRWKGDGAPGASVRGVATVQRSEVSMAWARGDGSGAEKEAVDEGLAAVICVGGGRLRARGHHDGQSSEVSMAWARGRTTTTAGVTTTTATRRARGCRATGLSESYDSYGGGDDNYLAANVKMGAEGRGKGPGWNRQK
jgi:hypothetical protein